MKNILYIGIAALVAGYAFAQMGVQPKTKNLDLCNLPQGPVEGLVGQTLSMKDGTLPNRVSILIGSPSSACTVAITMTRAQVNFSIGEIISIDGIASPFGVSTTKVKRSPNYSFDMNGDSGLDNVVGIFSYRDVVRCGGMSSVDFGSPYNYKLKTDKGDLSLGDAQITVINRYSEPTRLRLTFTRNMEVSSISEY